MGEARRGGNRCGDGPADERSESGDRLAGLGIVIGRETPESNKSQLGREFIWFGDDRVAESRREGKKYSSSYYSSNSSTQQYYCCLYYFIKRKRESLVQLFKPTGI